MKLNNNELLLLENSLNTLIEKHQFEIEEIRQLEDCHYERRLKLNQFRSKPLTIDDLREKELQKERDKIREIEDLKKKLFFSDNSILVVSNMIKLAISETR